MINICICSSWRLNIADYICEHSDNMTNFFLVFIIINYYYSHRKLVDRFHENHFVTTRITVAKFTDVL